jgi:regulator of replication initiation timing
MVRALPFALLILLCQANASTATLTSRVTLLETRAEEEQRALETVKAQLKETLVERDQLKILNDELRCV